MGRHTPEQKRRYNKTWREKHHAEILLREALKRQENREKDIARGAAYRAANPDKIKASALKFNLAHPGARKTISLRYRLKHPERVKQRKRRWYQEHPDYAQITRERRRANLEGVAINDFTRAQWKAMKEHYGHRCVYCGRKMQRLTMDHIIPLSQGGNHTYSNIVPACKSCNSRKHTGPVLRPIQPLLLL